MRRTIVTAVVDLLDSSLLVRALDSFVVLHDIHAYIYAHQPWPAWPSAARHDTLSLVNSLLVADVVASPSPPQPKSAIAVITVAITSTNATKTSVANANLALRGLPPTRLHLRSRLSPLTSAASPTPSPRKCVTKASATAFAITSTITAKTSPLPTTPGRC